MKSMLREPITAIELEGMVFCCFGFELFPGNDVSLVLVLLLGFDFSLLSCFSLFFKGVLLVLGKDVEYLYGARRLGNLWERVSCVRLHIWGWLNISQGYI